MTERDKERGGDEGVLAPSISLTELLRRENETIFDGALLILGTYRTLCADVGLSVDIFSNIRRKKAVIEKKNVLYLDYPRKEKTSFRVFHTN